MVFELQRWHKRFLSGVVLAPFVIGIIWAGGPLFLAFVTLCAGLCLYEWLKLSRRSSYWIIFSVIGAAYILFSFWVLYSIRMDYGVKVALLFLTMIWASDMGAYFTGKSIGGPKMSPMISPNKTWAGFIGATFFPGLCAALFILIYNLIYGLDVSKMYLFETLLAFMTVGILIGLVGQSGDLLVSWFKRHVDVKDASSLIPGHGGLLDRVDAMMLAAPVFLWIVAKHANVFPG